MAHIVFSVPPMTGPINSSLGLARNLMERGHTITYMGIADCKPTLYANKFNFIPIYENWFPSGWLNRFYEVFDNKGAIEAYADVIKFVDYLISGGDQEFLHTTQQIKADVFLVIASEVDSIIWALLAHKSGLPTLYLFDVLGGQANLDSPPIYTDLIADGNLFSYCQSAWAWFNHYINYKKYHLYFKYKKIAYLSPDKIEKLALNCNYPKNGIIYFTDMPSPLIKIPQLALFPKEFEFPIVKRKNRFYGNAGIDLKRKQEQFPWQKLSENKPLVYVALSSLPMLETEKTIRFFQAIIDAASEWPEWDWVITIGNKLCESDFNNVKPNMILVNRAPQLDLLKKAMLMITHGGPSSIKECIFFGVPMIAFPLWFDQPGNVARLVFHELGIKGNFDNINKEYLQNLIIEIINNQNIQNKIKIMQKKFLSSELQNTSASIIENFFAGI